MSYLERKYPRAVPGPDCRLHFQAGDFACAGLALSTVGLGGCSFALPAHLADAVKDGLSLEAMRLELPDRLLHEVQARIVWVAGRNPVMVGLEFQNLPEELAEAIASLVATKRPGPSIRKGY